MSAPSLHADLVVVGSGASGLTAAFTAASLGLDVVVVEKEPHLGGTSAWSGGWMWIPRNPLAQEAGIDEPLEAPLDYLRHELGPQFDEAMARRFLEQGPRMIAFLRDEAKMTFVDGNKIPDFHDKTPGAGLGGRSLCAAPFDGRRLGVRLKELREPLPEISPFGMGIASGLDLKNFFDAFLKPKAFWHVTKRVVRHWLDVLIHGRGMHLVNGNALVAQLLAALDARGVKILLQCPVVSLIQSEGRITGVKTAQGVITSRCGVVLAAGGFPHDLARKAALFPHAPTGHEHHSAAPLTNTGDGLRLGEEVGGHVRTDLAHAGAWAPVSLVPNDKGPAGRFPHLVERAKPGLIMVLRNGLRFANEADAYHDLMQALFRAMPAGEAPEAFMICDHRFQRRYGRGESAYNRIQGEADHSPNPCVAPLLEAPFYAVKIVAGSLGTFAGLKTNQDAQVLNQSGEPISGLYAVGNDMASMMGGHYPAGGISLGPGMTFGFIAAHHASGVPLANNR